MKLIVDTKSKILSVARTHYSTATRALYNDITADFFPIKRLYTQPRTLVTESFFRETQDRKFSALSVLHQYSQYFSEAEQYDLDEHYALHLNGLCLILKKPALNIVASEFTQEGEELPVYSFFAKPLVEYFPAQHFYTTQSDELYAKNMALHYHGIRQGVRKEQLVESKMYDNVDRLSVLSTFLFDETLSIEADVIQLKSLSSGKDFDYSKTRYTQAKFRNKQCLLPVYLPAELYDFETKENKKIFFYTFLFNSNPEKIKRYKKARVYFKKVLDSLMRYEGAHFYDLEKYNELYYAFALNRFINPEKADLYEQMQNYHISLDTSVRSSADLIDATATYVYPQKLLAKKAKYKRNKEEAYTSIQDSYQSFSNIRSQILEVQSQKEMIRTRLAQLKRTQEYLEEKSQELDQSYSRLPNLISTLKSNVLKHSQSTKAALSLQDLFLQYQTEENKQPNQTLQNLLSSYEFVNLIFKDKSSGTKYSFAEDSQAAKTALTSDPKYKDNYILEQIQLRTKEPTPIRVDGSDTKVKVGGPYDILCFKSNLNVRPLSIDAYYAIDNINDHRASILVHPHANNININTDNQDNVPWSNACLGEASTLIYKAFEDWDIPRVIIAINLWLTSANSSDVWGRRYDRFENWSDHLAYEEHLASIQHKQPTFKEVVQETPETNETQDSNTITLVEPVSHEEPTPSPDAFLPHQEESQTYTPYIATR